MVNGNVKKLFLGTILLVVAIAVLVYGYFHISQPNQPPVLSSTASTSSAEIVPTKSLPEGWVWYTNEQFRVSFGYPAYWTLNVHTGDFGTSKGDEYFRVSDGYYDFPSSIDGIVDIDIIHKLRPYGSNPTIDRLIIDECDARLVWPSKDVLKYGEDDSPALYVSCSHFPGFFYLQANKDHVEQIINTMEFHP